MQSQIEKLREDYKAMIIFYHSCFVKMAEWNKDSGAIVTEIVVSDDFKEVTLKTILPGEVKTLDVDCVFSI